MNKFAKGLVTLGAVAGAGALCFVTGGLAAPVVGSAIGSTFMGLSGAAATSAGLAALGGGSLAVGGAGMVGGTALVSGVAAGLGATGAGVGAVIHSGEKAKRENKDLTQKYQDVCKDEKAKQEIIKKQQVQIDELRKQVKELDKTAVDYHEKYENLMHQITDLEAQIIKEKRAVI